MAAAAKGKAAQQKYIAAGMPCQERGIHFGANGGAVRLEPFWEAAGGEDVMPVKVKKTKEKIDKMTKVELE